MADDSGGAETPAVKTGTKREGIERIYLEFETSGNLGRRRGW